MEKEKNAQEKPKPKGPEYYTDEQLNDMRMLFGMPEEEIQAIIEKQNKQKQELEDQEILFKEHMEETEKKSEEVEELELEIIENNEPEANGPAEIESMQDLDICNSQDVEMVQEEKDVKQEASQSQENSYKAPVYIEVEDSVHDHNQSVQELSQTLEESAQQMNSLHVQQAAFKEKETELQRQIEEIKR